MAVRVCICKGRLRTDFFLYQWTFRLEDNKSQEINYVNVVASTIKRANFLQLHEDFFLFRQGAKIFFLDIKINVGNTWQKINFSHTRFGRFLERFIAHNKTHCFGIFENIWKKKLVCERENERWEQWWMAGNLLRIATTTFASFL